MGIGTVLRISVGLLASSIGSSHHAAAVPPAIQARYAVLIAALEKPNLKAFDACFAPQYLSTDLTGKTSKRAAYLAGIHDLVKGAKKTTVKIQLKGAHSHDGVIDVSFECKGVITKATGATTLHEVGEDTWKKIGKTFLLVKTVDSIMDVKVPSAKKK